MNCAIYARVSTSDQNCEMQLRELREYASRRNWTISQEYIDTGWSGAKASRPALDKLMLAASQHRFDCVLVWTLDRFGRSVPHLVEGLNKLGSRGVRFLATNQGIDTDQANPTSRLLLWVLAAVAEFERALIQERVAAGLRRYAADYRAGKVGKNKLRQSHSGMNLPPGRPRKIIAAGKVLALRGKGQSIRQIAAALSLKRSTVARCLKSAA